MGELWNSGNKSFNIDNINILYKYLTGNAEGNYDNVVSLASSTTTAANIRGKTLSSGSGYNAKSSSQDVIVTLGGLKWEVVYLSNNTDSEPTLTLWLSNSTQEAFKSRSRTEGLYYGYYNGGLYSDWSADWYNGTPGNYPSNMYGTSYIRAVTLNNGGQYATNNSTLGGNASKSTSSVFAPYTVDSYGMTEYIVKPTKMSWQRDQSSKDILGSFTSYTLPNEAIAPSNTNWYNSTYDYSTKTNYTIWGNDNLWLPSIAETGYSVNGIGMWGLSENQRKNYNGSTEYISLSGAVGSSNTSNNSSVYNSSWLRSGNANTTSLASSSPLAGNDYSYKRITYSYAVRPALHLNLKKVQDEVMSNFWEGVAAENYAGGIGTETNPYIIKTPEQLGKLAKDSRSSNLSGKYYKLGGNIDLSEHIWTGIGMDSLKFAGNFNGDFYTIQKMQSLEESNKTSRVGLFSCLREATVQNLIMKDCKLDGLDYVGSIAGIVEESTIRNIDVRDVTINSDEGHVGGITGTFSGELQACTVKNASITLGHWEAGGITGSFYGGNIKDCSILGINLNGPERLGIVHGYISGGLTIQSSYGYAIINGENVKQMYGDSNAWGNWSYHPSLNGGYPVQKTLFHIGGITGSKAVHDYLITKGFGNNLYDPSKVVELSSKIKVNDDKSFTFTSNGTGSGTDFANFFYSYDGTIPANTPVTVVYELISATGKDNAHLVLCSPYDGGPDPADVGNGKVDLGADMPTGNKPSIRVIKFTTNGHADRAYNFRSYIYYDNDKRIDIKFRISVFIGDIDIDINSFEYSL